MTEAAPAPEYALDETGKVIDARTRKPVDTITVLSQPEPQEGRAETRAPSAESPMATLARWRSFRQESSVK